jgi:pyruvate dehydrogenase (quinone)
MAELITISRYWEQWEDPRLVVVVLHNNDLNQVTWEMRAMTGVPKFADSQEIPDVSYAAFAKEVGLEAMTVTKPEEVAGAWDRALAAGRPAVIDAYSDPDIPPIPPHATMEQMIDSAKAILAGDEDAWGIVKTGVRQKAQEFLPGRKER